MKVKVIGVLVMNLFLTSTVFSMQIARESTIQPEKEQEYVIRQISLVFLAKIKEIRERLRNTIRDDNNCFYSNAQMDSNITLESAIDGYRESAMSITKAQKSERAIMENLVNIFTFFYGNLPINFWQSSQKICARVQELNTKNSNLHSTIGFHLASSHDNFPALERLVWMFDVLDGDADTLIYSHGSACMNGLNGRLVFLVMTMLEAKLKECLDNPSAYSQAYGHLKAMPGMKAELESHEGYYAEMKKREEEKRVQMELEKQEKVQMNEAESKELECPSGKKNYCVIDDETGAQLLQPMNVGIDSVEGRALLGEWGYILRRDLSKE